MKGGEKDMGNSSVKARFVQVPIENNPLIPDGYEKIPYDIVRKARDEIRNILHESKLTIRQSATVLDLVKDSLLDKIV